MIATPPALPKRGRQGKAIMAALLLTLGGCDLLRDCSLAARLERHAVERERFREPLSGVVVPDLCPSSVTEDLVPEMGRVADYKKDLLRRVRASELRSDLEQVEREQEEMQMVVECATQNFPPGEQEIREARAGAETELQQLRQLDAQFQALAARVNEC